MRRVAFQGALVRGRGTATSLAAFAALASSCVPPPPASAGIDVELAGLSGATARLSVEDDDGAPAVFDIKDADDELRRATGSVDIGCRNAGAGIVCSAALVLDAGAYRFTLDLVQRDRCGASATTVSLSSGDEPIVLDRGAARAVVMTVARADFDDDGDGIVNALERTVCGRFDIADGALPPQHCAEDDACCSSFPPPSPLQGQRAVFAGGRHRNVDDVEVDVAPFALDATELTWRAFSRCVAAGACLFGQPDHAVRQRLDDPALDDDAPVTGLVPREAAAFCAWRGGRLPDDDEWDFAAAGREGAPRGIYPFDLPPDTGVGAIGCVDDGGGVAVNHAARGRACPGVPVAVGSYPSTYVQRGAGSALADLAGNVGEWTVRRGARAATSDGTEVVVSSDPFPDGVIEVDVRGGNAAGIVELLENDIVLRVTPATADPAARLRDLAETTGVRCAFDVAGVEGVAAAAVPVEEPACGAKQ